MVMNTNTIERHGCLVCANIFEVLVVQHPDGSLVGYSVTTPGGHIVPDEHQALVACDTHTTLEIETAHKKWHYPKRTFLDHEQNDE